MRVATSCNLTRRAWLGLAFALLILPGSTAEAQETILFPAIDDAQTPIVERLRNEPVRLDIATWYLTDRRLSAAIVQRFRAGLPVRVIGDRVSIFEIAPAVRREFEYLATNGVPIRLRYHPTSFPTIMHWKCGIFVGQNTVEFGSANWTPFELGPASATNFKDETAMFTSDPALVNAFKTRFDQMWVDTTNFLDWPEAYQRETGRPWTTPMTIPRGRLEPDHPTPPGLIWSQGPELNDPLTAAIDRETRSVDMVIYRLSVPNITDALIRKLQARIPVRIFIEPSQYRNSVFPEYWLTGSRIDQLWVAGAQIKQRTHQGITHMKVLITPTEAMMGSANFTKNWERDHNYFIQAAAKPHLHAQLVNRFSQMWADTTNYTAFQPQRPRAPTLVSPPDGAAAVPGATLTWMRAPWAVAFDVYIGTSQTNLAFAGRVNAPQIEDPPTRYSFTAPGGLLPRTRYFWRVVSRTFATDANPALVAASPTRSFTTGDTTITTPRNLRVIR
jgi:phosphatidylserine/phosphatidylglycerophosphate/cardiolipin synthase-like enzyme